MVDYFCTPELRYVRRPLHLPALPGDELSPPRGVRSQLVLQQMWRGSDGSTKWEDVPVVDEQAPEPATRPQGGSSCR